MAAELAVNPATGAASAGRFWMIAAAIASLVAIVAVVSPFLARGGAARLTEQDTIVLADFMNTTGEPVFDGALKVALAVALEQSPFIKIFPDDRVRDVLRLMNRPIDQPLVRSVAREVAQREQLKALLAGSIASLGRNYVIAIEAVNAQSGDVMAREQVEVPQKEQVLASLGRAAARLREKLGESLASIRRFDVPLPRATTSSLEALHSYALALDQDRLVARAGAVPHLKRAIEPRSGLRARPRAALRLLRQLRAVHARPGVFAAGVRASRPGQRARAVLHLVALLPRRDAGLGQGLRAGAHLDCDVPPRGVCVQQPRARRTTRSVNSNRRSRRSRPRADWTPASSHLSKASARRSSR
jgi:hypothetical protein